MVVIGTIAVAVAAKPTFDWSFLLLDYLQKEERAFPKNKETALLRTGTRAITVGHHF